MQNSKSCYCFPNADELRKKYWTSEMAYLTEKTQRRAVQQLAGKTVSDCPREAKSLVDYHILNLCSGNNPACLMAEMSGDMLTNDLTKHLENISTPCPCEIPNPK